MGWESKVNNLLGHCTSEAAFGTMMRHIPRVGAAQDLRGIWSDVYATTDPENGVAVMSSEPNVGFRIADLKTYPRKDDEIYRVSSKTRYIVREVSPDGEGGVTLVLEKVKC